MTSGSARTIALGQRLGPYRIEGLLGTGGMGRVYLAVDTQLKRTVAIKVVDALPQNQLALLREARFAAALNHPAICTVHEVGHADDGPFVVMEHVKGISLALIIRRNGALPLETALSYELQVADAVRHAHACGIVHGDVKTSNIMVAADGRVKVLDFGLAVRRSVPSVDHGQDEDVDTTCPSPSSGGAGTVPYMAPELLRGSAPDVQSDIWALGVVLYEMLTGGRPFHGVTAYEVAARILGNDRLNYPERLPAAVCSVIERCLSMHPADRYAGVGEFVSALDDVAWAPTPLEKSRAGSSIQREQRCQAAADDE